MASAIGVRGAFRTAARPSTVRSRSDWRRFLLLIRPASGTHHGLIRPCSRT